MLIGSGPIVIGQACEFDYSGTQGAKALRQEGYEVVLVNSNPATIMTDPEFSDRTYIEPLTVDYLREIIAKERPDALLPTLGGQTALNLAVDLAREGVLEKFGVELIGASLDAIHTAEDRELFKQAMKRIGLSVPLAFTCKNMDDAKRATEETGYPVILRPSFTMGGSGGGIAYTPEEFEEKILWAFSQSPTHECLVEQSVLGWKEFELEVIRDRIDNFSVICTIENFDPMGVHTGDSITVAPSMTLTDREYQRMRDAGRAVITEVGVETGGANIQFGVNPKNGDLVVIEMNPRVSRSSALASKATGYPIAKIAAKLAVGFTLDELKNDMIGTSAAFEPTIDYVVVKIPRFAFEKFGGSDPRLTTQMKSVGEAMAIGRTFKEALQKGARSLETGRDGLVSLIGRLDYAELAKRIRERQEPLQMPTTSADEIPELSNDELAPHLLDVIAQPLPDRLWFLADALRVGLSVGQVVERTSIDSWFITQLAQIVEAERALVESKNFGLTQAKEMGFSDQQVSSLQSRSREDVRASRREGSVKPIYCHVDTCAAEFAPKTNYLYSTWGDVSERVRSEGKRIMILGGGPNRIGQGIEFDYCCVHASFACKELGYETVMVNCNPETVSTDYDTSDRLYFEPLTFEDVMNIIAVEQPDGVIVQFGGQTPLRLAVALDKAGVPILGTSADAIDRAEDRERFETLMEKLGLRRPRGGIARNVDDAFEIAEKIGYPVVVRPSYVLGGRAMEVVYSEGDLRRYISEALSELEEVSAQTILIDEFLEDAIEVDVDCASDGQDVLIGGIMQHIEEAGIHSGDSSLVLPPHALPAEVLATIREVTRALALELGVVGLMNVQFAVRGSGVYVIEVNPRASRTVPFVSKAIGVPLAKIAAKLMVGVKLRELSIGKTVSNRFVAVKESVFPFHKFAGVDILLGPEMRSTGEVMGIGETFADAFLKALDAAGTRLPAKGTVFFSVRDRDKHAACEVARRFADMGFSVLATRGTAKVFERAGVVTKPVNKVRDGEPHCVDAIRDGDVQIVVNTTQGTEQIADSRSLRRQTLMSGVPYFTTIAAGIAAVGALESRLKGRTTVAALQDIHSLDERRRPR